MALAKDLRSVRDAHLRRLREAPEVAGDFQDLADALDTVTNTCDRIKSDPTRSDMLLSAIRFRNDTGPFLLPQVELQRLVQSNTELRLLARHCADTSMFLSKISNEIGVASHYLLLSRALPRIFEKHFGRPFGRSTDLMGQRTGPGVRFVMAAAQLIGIRRRDGKPYSPEILGTAKSKAGRKRRQ